MIDLWQLSDLSLARSHFGIDSGSIVQAVVTFVGVGLLIGLDFDNTLVCYDEAGID